MEITVYYHITVTDMLLGQIPVCCRYVTDICHITVIISCHTVTECIYGYQSPMYV